MKPLSPRYRCSVCGATTNMVFTYPRDPVRRQEWARILRTSWRSTVHLDWLCGNHFADEDFSNRFKNRLKWNVYPLAPEHTFVRAPKSLSPWGPVRLPTGSEHYSYVMSKLHPVSGEEFTGTDPDSDQEDDSSVDEYSAEKLQMNLGYPIRRVNDRRAFNPDMAMVALVEPHASDQVDSAVGLAVDELSWTNWRSSSKNDMDDKHETRLLGKLKQRFVSWKNKGTIEPTDQKPGPPHKSIMKVSVNEPQIVEKPTTKSTELLAEPERVLEECVIRVAPDNIQLITGDKDPFPIDMDILREIAHREGKMHQQRGTSCCDNDAIDDFRNSLDQRRAIQYDLKLMKMAARKSRHLDSPNERIASFVRPIVTPVEQQFAMEGAYPKYVESRKPNRWSLEDPQDRV